MFHIQQLLNFSIMKQNVGLSWDKSHWDRCPSQRYLSGSCSGDLFTKGFPEENSVSCLIPVHLIIKNVKRTDETNMFLLEINVFM